MSRRTGPGLSRERVLAAGLNLVDREGVGALTMRRLGRELGVEAMSLYGYVRSKKDLLEGVVDCVYREIPPMVDSNGQWQERLRDTALMFRQVLLRHPNLVNMVAARPFLNEGNLCLAESALSQLRLSGLDLVRASQVVTVVVAFTVGHVVSEVGDGGTESHRSIDSARFPNIAERCTLGPLDRDASFALGLDFTVAGVEGLMHSVLATR
jgi:TetR/AcrR family tetracycline transcriptional repressor